MRDETEAEPHPRTLGAMAVQRKRRLTTGEAARAVGIAPGTLRALDRRGIFRARRDWNGDRTYAPSDLPRLREIVGLPPALEHDVGTLADAERLLDQVGGDDIQAHDAIAAVVARRDTRQATAVHGRVEETERGVRP